MISILGQNIKRIRESQEISGNELAIKSEIASSTISQIETGKRMSLKGDTINKIAKSLNVSVEDLMCDKNEKKNYDISYIVNEFKENEITFEGKLLTEDEIELIELNLNTALKSIKIIRSK